MEALMFGLLKAAAILVGMGMVLGFAAVCLIAGISIVLWPVGRAYHLFFPKKADDE